MIKAAIEKILEISLPVTQVIDGRNYVLYSDHIEEIRPCLDKVSTIHLSSLDGLIKMVKTEALKRYSAPIYITIPNHLRVDCFSQPEEKLWEQRLTYYVADATDVPGWEAQTSLKFEEAMIAIRTRFQESADSLYVLKLLSDITTGSKVTYSDNGIATSVVTKTGVALQSNEPIRPIVSLRPYRTFQEVEQPASQFLIRINERGINFVEADGGMWKLEARKTIKAFLEEALAHEVNESLVVIAL